MDSCGPLADGRMDDRIAALAAKSANFGFLLQHEPLLVLYGAAAEAAIFNDPNGAIIKARQFGEVLATDLVRRSGVSTAADRQIDRLRALKHEGLLHGDVVLAFDHLRGVGNRAAHHLSSGGRLGSQQEALEAVQTCFRLGVWFHRLVTGSRDQMPFIPPDPPAESGDASRHEAAALRTALEHARLALVEARLTLEDNADRAGAESGARCRAEGELAQARAMQEELAALAAEMQHEMTAIRRRFNASQPSSSLQERELLISNAEIAAREPLGEAQIRLQLDRMLGDAGWSVQDSGVGQDLWAAQGVALREVTTTAGRADYLLYVGPQAGRCY